MDIIVIDDVAKEIYSTTDKFKSITGVLNKHYTDTGNKADNYALITENTIVMRKDTQKTIYTLD